MASDQKLAGIIGEAEKHSAAVMMVVPNVIHEQTDHKAEPRSTR